MLKVVFDINVYISAFISPNSKSEEAYLLAVNGKVKLYISVAILTETARKLREKFMWDNNRITAALRHIIRVSIVIKPLKRLNVLTDAPDNRVLECAKESDADLIVTQTTGLKKSYLLGLILVLRFETFTNLPVASAARTPSEVTAFA